MNLRRRSITILPLSMRSREKATLHTHAKAGGHTLISLTPNFSWVAQTPGLLSNRFNLKNA